MRPELAALALCLLSLPVSAQQADPAYVDSLENKSIPDPARTDGRSRSGAGAQVAQRHADDQAMARHQAAQAAETERHIREQMDEFTAAHVAAIEGQEQAAANAYADPPVGGHSMLRQLEGSTGAAGWPDDPGTNRAPTPQTGIGGQIGSALLQDAAGAVDAGIERKVYGRNGRIVLPVTASDDAPGL
ncbi:hypothetical protein [Lysobacter sp. M15]|uniref:hypothetical protein n=1 Tax=Lysobacter sp. M15 TaxID=2916837 RepID=UPI001F5864CF|nr:hypothetical protein [Lysobacter sp. M15]